MNDIQKAIQEGSKFFDAYYKIVESDLDFEPYIKDIENYIENINIYNKYD